MGNSQAHDRSFPNLKTAGFLNQILLADDFAES
jgi:hypothetical protein